MPLPSLRTAVQVTMVHRVTPRLSSVDVQQHHARYRATCSVSVLQRVVAYAGRAATAVRAIGTGPEPFGSSRSVLTAVTVW